MRQFAIDMPRQPRPKGPFYAVDPVWKADIRALMERQEISQAEMSRRIGCAQSALNLLWQPQTVQSRLVPAIHKALGLEAPQTTTISERDDARRRLDRIWRDLSADERELVLTVAAKFKR